MYTLDEMWKDIATEIIKIEVFNLLPFAYFMCPYINCRKNPGAMRNMAHSIVHLNDYHKWPFIMIAEWIDSLPANYAIKENNV